MDELCRQTPSHVMQERNYALTHNTETGQYLLHLDILYTQELLHPSRFQNLLQNTHTPINIGSSIV